MYGQTCQIGCTFYVCVFFFLLHSRFVDVLRERGQLSGTRCIGQACKCSEGFVNKLRAKTTAGEMVLRYFSNSTVRNC